MERRDFLAALLASGAASSLAGEQASAAAASAEVERMTAPTGPGWDAEFAAGADQMRWVQVDLGASRKIDAIKLYPKFSAPAQTGREFPVRFRIEAGEDPGFQNKRLVFEQSEDLADPVDRIQTYAASGSAWYVRVTATKLREVPERAVPGGAPEKPRYGFSLAKLDVLSGGKDLAEGRPISDSTRGELGVTALTRAPRPQGETVVTDHPENVTQPALWRRPVERVSVPRGGVRLEDGLLKTGFENNIEYLLSSYPVDDLLKEFRDRAGKPSPEPSRPPGRFWQTALAGSNAGRFLMGAANSVRWTEHAELRRRIDQVVDGIAECRQANGYIMAYPEDTIFQSERGAYTRAWLTHGLIEAGYSGNRKAFELLRGYYDWFDQCPYLPQLLRRAIQGVQGMVANTRMYLTPVGRPADIQVIQRYFQENYWLEQLARRDEAAIWLYPYDRPHCYLITDLEAYMDLYLATGERRYLDATEGGWELYRDKWEHVGGTIAICEGGVYPPGSYRLHARTGELCGNAFLSFLSQRFHRLYPDEEKYVNEIEKSIYNVALANQAGGRGIRYTAYLTGRKDKVRCENTCCEGQGTRLLGAMPEFIYSVAPDGVYVNLFAASTLEWLQPGQAMKLEMRTQFPFRPEVEVRVLAAQSVKAKLRVRVPEWARTDMTVRVNGAGEGPGRPGSYVTVERVWKGGDVVSFTLPMGFRLTYYRGDERVAGQEQYALEYGPLLMALVGDVEENGMAHIVYRPEELVRKLRPKQDAPLHFAIDGDAKHEYMPYWQVDERNFTCYPVMGKGPHPVMMAN
jgi:DUF1680 family protein